MARSAEKLQHRLKHEADAMDGPIVDEMPIAKHGRGEERRGRMDDTHDRSDGKMKSSKRQKTLTGSAQNDTVHVARRVKRSQHRLKHKTDAVDGPIVDETPIAKHAKGEKRCGRVDGTHVSSYGKRKSSKRQKTGTGSAQNDTGPKQDDGLSSEKLKLRSCKGRTNKKQSRRKKPTNAKDGDIRETAFRASLNGIRTLVKELPLREEHKNLMKRTPFWRFFHAILEDKLTSELCRKSDLMIIKIINAYDPDTGGFKIGAGSYKITRADVAKIFGITDGAEKVVLKQASRDAVKMANKGLVVEQRLTSLSIKKVTEKYAKRMEEEYIPVVVSLLCAFLLHSLLCPTGTTVKWVCLKRVEDLDQLNNYDWCGAILDELMASIKKRHTEPRKVLGCVVILLYWLCEHTNLVTPLNPDETLGVVKWRTTDLLTHFENKTLAELDSDKVIPGSFDDTQYTECSTPDGGASVEVVMPHGVQTESGNFNLAGECLLQPRNNVECVSGGVPRIESLQDGGTSAGGVNIGDGLHPDPDQRQVIDELVAKIAKLTGQMEQNDESYKSDIAKKDAEIAILNETVMQLQIEKGKLEDELTESVVHAVTQHAEQVTEVQQERSMITRLKTRKRIDTQKEDFVYDHKGKVNAKGGDAKKVVDVDKLPSTSMNVIKKKPLPIKGLSANSVYRLITPYARERFRRLMENGYDRDCVWISPISEVGVVIEDIRCLIDKSALQGNVIDAYTEFLFVEQENKAKMLPAVGTQSENKSCYVFACHFLASCKAKRDVERMVLIDKLMGHTPRFCYLMFPIHYGFHWTLLVLDSEEGSWMFYNSLKERTGVDPHLKEAEQLKNMLENYWKNTKHGMLMTQDCRTIVPVNDCPQQADDSLDCGVIVCYIAQKYFNQEPVPSKLDKGFTSKMRADMVELFLRRDVE